MITSKQRSYLRGLAAAEDTIIQVGKGGINDNLIASVDAALKARELVKGRADGERAAAPGSVSRGAGRTAAPQGAGGGEPLH